MSEIAQQAASLAREAVEAIAAADTPAALEELRIRFLGKKSDLIGLSRRMKEVPKEEKKEVGQAINAAKSSVENALAERKEALESDPAAEAASGVDVTMPGVRTAVGRRHPLLSTMEEIKGVLIGMGYRYDDYPEVETEFYNFDGLNTPDWHPARDMHDTFYTEDGHVLRTHTTAFQVHAMEALHAEGKTPPLRAMTAGRCYRCDTIDATHYPIFHQLDVIAIDKGISFADLKWTLYELARALFGDDVQLRFRPSFFPFTTPSAEVDVFFRGKWLEILGSGMMRPEVLRHGKLDPETYQGFAFGLGIDRMAMIRHGIDDIRAMYDNEAAFLRQF